MPKGAPWRDFPLYVEVDAIYNLACPSGAQDVSGPQRARRTQRFAGQKMVSTASWALCSGNYLLRKEQQNASPRLNYSEAAQLA